MRAYIIQHAEARRVEDNPPVRTLSEKGTEDTYRLANYINSSGDVADRFMHVGSEWTQDNAEKLAKFMGSEGKASQTPYVLTRETDITAFIDDLNSTSDTVVASTPSDVAMRAVTRLLTGREDPVILAKASGLCSCLERGDDGVWKLLWMVKPDQLPGWYSI
jgi:phosphohistidine phosphatase SixA